MDSEIVDAITEWDQAPFSSGYEGLAKLADGEFSGAVTQGTAWGFMLNGRLIGIEDGSLSSFEGRDGTAYTAPTPALPLLFAMQPTGEKQAQYYTNEKSISEADSTLGSGGFTGYIELSENVLSGDYYTVYYGGKSMSVAFVGNSRKLLTDEEAFERADDEVGIYTVYAADLDVIEIPDSTGSENTAQSTDESTAATGSPSDGSTEKTDETAPDELAAEATDASTADVDVDADTDTDADADAGAASAATDRSTPPDAANESVRADSGSTDASSSGSAPRQSTAEPSTETAKQSPVDATETRSAEASSTGVFSDEAEWRNSKTIPSLDPSDDPDRTASTSRSQQSAAQAKQATKQQSKLRSLSRGQLQKRLKRAEQIMEKAEAQHETLIAERDALRAERDEAHEELEAVRAKLSEAQAEIDRLESQLESGAETDPTAVDGEVPSGSQSMSTTAALEGTNLLVRYASKGDGTLEDAISGTAEQEAVKNNLRIEPHTTFDREQVSVDGRPFDQFLESRIELAFVRWLAEEFLFDIQQTGNQTDLSGIYETLPAINRAELQGTVSLGTDEEGDELTATFDLVVRDKRDRPLFVADFNESKQPVGGGMVNSLVRDGSEITQRNESFAAAFAVTTSYYEGAALDAAADATGGGLLSASRGKSFVYISRKQGFHLCLVERLGDTFDLHVPEL